MIHSVFFSLGLPIKDLSTKKLIRDRLGLSRTTYVRVGSPYLIILDIHLFQNHTLADTLGQKLNVGELSGTQFFLLELLV